MAQNETMAALQTLYERIEALRNMKITDMLTNIRETQYTQTLEDAYAALAKVEEELDELAQELEYHHQRIGGATQSEPDTYAQG